MPEDAGPIAGPSHAVTRALSRNESPHDPPPGILATVAASGRDVNRYPDPACADLILALTHRHGMEPERVAVGAPRVVASLRGMSLPYGVSGPAQHTAVAALGHEEVLLTRVRETVAERARVRAALLADGFPVPVSQANLVGLGLGLGLRLGLGAGSGPFGRWCARAGVELRVFDGDGVRVSIGSPSDNDAFLAAVRRWRTRGAPQLLTTGAVG